MVDIYTHHNEHSAFVSHEPRLSTVLLVEDNRADARLIQIMLAESAAPHLKIETAQNLASGLQRISKNDIDLVLLDLSLPDSQGIDTFLKAILAAPHIPFVVLSGLDDEELATMAVQKGAQDYLVKGQIEGPLLWRVMLYAVERKLVQKELQQINESLERRVKKRTEELNKANEDLRELDRMKSAFITQTSHELRTPVSTICGMLSILEGKMQYLDAEAGSMVRSAISAAQKLEKMTYRALKISYEGDYKNGLHLQPTDIKELANQVMMNLGIFIRLRKMQVHLELPEQLPRINCDVQKISDVITNLIMNAIKFTPDAGDIFLAVEQDSPDKIVMTVRDTGVGIREEDLAHVFDPFFSSFDTLHHSSGDYEFEKRGIGLGLSIAKRFVEMHSGTIYLASRQQEGTTVKVTLPLQNS